MSRIDELTDRIERLLLRHEELRRTNDLLSQQVTVITQERDSLRARLAAARGRIDALIDKLPLPPSGAHGHGHGHGHADADDADPHPHADDLDTAEPGHSATPDA